jgi:hypothetical protein
LIAGLPDGALCKQDNPGETPWGVTEELLAQLVEEVSVLAADRRRKDPITIPRPGQPTVAPAGISGTASTGVQARGMAGLLAAAEVFGAVRTHE